MIDYLVVGFGLAGMSFVETALQNSKKVCVISNHKQSSSRVAAGLYNPVVLKRFTSIWHAKEQLDLLYPFYKSIEARLSISILHEMPIYRKFHSIEEQNDWIVASDKPHLSSFLNSNFVTSNIPNINTTYHYGHVYNSGFVRVDVLLDAYEAFLKAKDIICFDVFDYTQLEVMDSYVSYKGINAKQIIFAEGFGMHHNPFFKGLPLDGTKGEVLTIKAPQLSLNVIVKAGIFIMPIGDHLFRVGATYNWKDKDNNPTIEGKLELEQKLKSLISCPYEIILHQAEVRPTVRDRRPLVGKHPIKPNMYLLNGLGTRGVMLGPYLSKQLFEYIENGKELHSEIDVIRYYS